MTHESCLAASRASGSAAGASAERIVVHRGAGQAVRVTLTGEAVNPDVYSHELAAALVYAAHGDGKQRLDAANAGARQGEVGLGGIAARSRG